MWICSQSLFCNVASFPFPNYLNALYLHSDLSNHNLISHQQIPTHENTHTKNTQQKANHYLNIFVHTSLFL